MKLFRLGVLAGALLLLPGAALPQARPPAQKTGPITITGLGSTGEVPGFTVAGRSLATWLNSGRDWELAWTADPTGRVDATAAVVNLVNLGCIAGGANIHVSGNFKLTSKVSVPCSNIKFVAPGNDGRHDVAPNTSAPSYNYSQPSGAFVWAGPTGGTMVEFSPAAGQSAGLGGVGSVGVAYICSVFPNTANVADTGLAVRGSVGGNFDVFAQECGSSNVLFDTVRTTPIPFEDSPRFLNVSRIDGKNVTTSGALLKLDGLTGYGNTYNNSFGIITGLYKNGPGIYFGSSDNNTLDNVRLQRADGGTGIGVVFAAGSANDNMARANVIRLLSPGAGGVLAQTGAFPSYQNKIEWYNPEENGAPAAPTIQTGATLFWRSAQSIGITTVNVALASDQSMPAGAFTKLAFTNAVADANGTLNSPQNRIVPKYPGWYMATLNVYVTNPDAAASGYQIRIRKNDGSGIAYRAIQSVPASQAESIVLSGPVFLNGTTDYVEADVRNGATAAATVSSAKDLTSLTLTPIN